MGFFGNLNIVMRVLRRAKRPMDAARLLQQRQSLRLAVNIFELAQLANNKMDHHLKALADVKTAALVGCPF